MINSEFSTCYHFCEDICIIMFDSAKIFFTYIFCSLLLSYLSEICPLIFVLFYFYFLLLFSSNNSYKINAIFVFFPIVPRYPCRKSFLWPMSSQQLFFSFLFIIVMVSPHCIFVYPAPTARQNFLLHANLLVLLFPYIFVVLTYFLFSFSYSPNHKMKKILARTLCSWLAHITATG